MGKIVIKDGAKWDYDPIWNRYTFIEKIEEKKEEPNEIKKNKKKEEK
jgi:hypothetical protein